MKDESPSSGIFFFSEVYFFKFWSKRKKQKEKNLFRAMQTLSKEFETAMSPQTVQPTCPWPPRLPAKDTSLQKSSRCVGETQVRPEPEQETDRRGSEWVIDVRSATGVVVVVVVGEEEGKKKKKEICDVRTRSCSGFVLIAQGHFSLFTPRRDRPIRASRQNV